MTTSYTLFGNALLSAWRDRVGDPFYSKMVDIYNRTPRYNLVSKLYETDALGDGDTRNLTIPSSIALADWQLIYVRVVGKAKLTITAKDTDGVTTITGILRAYGTSVLPGIILLSDYNISALVITGEEDDTTVEVFRAEVEDD